MTDLNLRFDYFEKFYGPISSHTTERSDLHNTSVLAKPKF